MPPSAAAGKGMMPPRRDATSSLRAAHARRPKSEADDTYRGTITDRHTRKVDATRNTELGGIHREKLPRNLFPRIQKGITTPTNRAPPVELACRNHGVAKGNGVIDGNISLLSTSILSLFPPSSPPPPARHSALLTVFVGPALVFFDLVLRLLEHRLEHLDPKSPKTRTPSLQAVAEAPSKLSIYVTPRNHDKHPLACKLSGSPKRQDLQVAVKPQVASFRLKTLVHVDPTSTFPLNIKPLALNIKPLNI
ncbi:hypothetical protein B0H16DRAFT_1698569 [Mycena metata]|uniref:Uncharacterized protein n=1 Tax=Mycena metata TaxID=1033252 RepID=A0AAD7HN98_9AGAR|nr:hypothetical protein B0H16DRAFT_1698569 [Mycena metata]